MAETAKHHEDNLADWSFASEIKLGEAIIGSTAPCFLIAEVGVNHGGDIDLAHKMVDAAVMAGANAVKFQTFETESVVSTAAEVADYQKRAVAGSETQFDLIKGLELSHDDFTSLNRHCREAGAIFLSTPFDVKSLEFLTSLGMLAIKVASGEITNTPFLHSVAKAGLPVILSTGMATLDEVDAALSLLASGITRSVAVLQCTSAYPSEPKDAHLRVIPALHNRYGVPVGLSDHTPGIVTAIGAAALGSCIIEKHFTLDRSMVGPDHAASLPPKEFRRLVDAVRTVEVALGSPRKKPLPVEADVRRAARRSIFLSRDLEAGAVITIDDLTLLRPGDGLPPAQMEQVVGRRLVRSLVAGTKLSSEHLVINDNSSSGPLNGD